MKYIVILLSLLLIISCSSNKTVETKQVLPKKEKISKDKEVNKTHTLSKQEKNRIVIHIETELDLDENLKKTIILGFEEIATENDYSIVDEETQKKVFEQITKDHKWKQNDPKFLLELKKQLSANKMVQIKIIKQESGKLLLTNRLIELQTGVTLKTSNNFHQPSIDKKYEKLFDEIQVLAKKFLSKSTLTNIYLEIDENLDITNLVKSKLTKTYILTDKEADSDQIFIFSSNASEQISITLEKKYPYGGTFFSKTTTCKEKSICVNELLHGIFKQRKITNKWGVKFVEIPKGVFMYGEAVKNQGDTWKFFENQDEINKVESNFYIATTETTQKFWKKIMGKNPSKNKGKNKPVEMISLNDINKFIEKLNKLDKKYNYRLPSEFEWEYAAKAGTNYKFFWGNSSSSLGHFAWHWGNAFKRSHDVAKKKANQWGLYDVAGNLYEFTSSNRIYTESARLTISQDSLIIVKGGSFGNKNTKLFEHSSFMMSKKGITENNKYYYVGFRLVIEKK